ncbi:hypothetical protein Hanom_Chr14g01278951 [Helianthus anomalus]
MAVKVLNLGVLNWVKVVKGEYGLFGVNGRVKMGLDNWVGMSEGGETGVGALRASMADVNVK